MHGLSLLSTTLFVFVLIVPCNHHYQGVLAINSYYAYVLHSLLYDYYMRGGRGPCILTRFDYEPLVVYAFSQHQPLR